MRQSQQSCHRSGGALGLLKEGMIFSICSSPNSLAGQDSKPGFPKYAGHGLWAVQNTCGYPRQITQISERVLALVSHAPGPGQPFPETRRTGFPWRQVPLHGKAGAIYPDELPQRPAKRRRGAIGSCFSSKLRQKMDFSCLSGATVPAPVWYPADYLAHEQAAGVLLASIEGHALGQLPLPRDEQNRGSLVVSLSLVPLVGVMLAGMRCVVSCPQLKKGKLTRNCVVQKPCSWAWVPRVQATVSLPLMA